MEMSSSGGRNINDLHDDLLVEILVRLPSETVLRCRAVCKAWRRIATDGAFLAAHAGRRPLEMLTLTQDWTVSAVPLSPDLDAADDGARQPGYLCDPRLYDGDGRTMTGCSMLLASLDGLLVLMQRPGLYVICNPATRQWTNLPVLAREPCSAASACGFYRHGPSGQYRLLCHGVEKETTTTPDCWTDYYYTLSAGDALPRRLALAPRPADDGDRTITPPAAARYQFPVAHRGILLWAWVHPLSNRTGKMLAFHTGWERFWLMSRPPTIGSSSSAALLELDGALCAIAVQEGAGTTTPVLDIWALQDYASESWALRHRVVAPPPIGIGPFGGDDGVPRLRVGMAISAGGGTIFFKGAPYSHVVRACDLKEKRVLPKEIDLDSTPAFVPFSESLVPHAFFQSPPRCPELAPLKFPTHRD